MAWDPPIIGKGKMNYKGQTWDFQDTQTDTDSPMYSPNFLSHVGCFHKWLVSNRAEESGNFQGTNWSFIFVNLDAF